MDQNTIRIELGDPAGDFAYLLHGFDVSFSFVNWPGEPKGRPVARRAALRVPTAAEGPTHVTLELSGHIAQEATVVCGGRELAQFTMEQGRGARVDVEIPAGLAPAGRPAVLEIHCARDLPKPHWFGKSLVMAALEVRGQGVRPLEGPLAPPPQHAARVFFGDPHVHTTLSLCHKGIPTAAERCAYARDHIGVDFIGLTDHAEHMDRTQWQDSLAQTVPYQEAGRFAILGGYEWTSELYGHRNVYFRRPDQAPLVSSVEYDTHTPAGLWRTLEQQVGLSNAITAPHHPAARSHLVDWSQYHEGFDRFVEVYQSRGQQELVTTTDFSAGGEHSGKCEPGATVHDALALGHRMGLAGGGDAHAGPPAKAGLTAVWADELSAGSIFQALYDRRCYATSGARIKLEFTVNGYPMGSALTRNLYEMGAEFPFRLAVRARGAGQIERVELLVNGWVVHQAACNNEQADVTWELPRPSFLVRTRGDIPQLEFFWLTSFTRYFQARVIQADGQRAWASPVWFVLQRAE